MCSNLRCFASGMCSVVATKKWWGVAGRISLNTANVSSYIIYTSRFLFLFTGTWERTSKNTPYIVFLY